MTRAIVFVPPVEHMFMYADRCYEHAAARHYDVESFVMGNWRQAAEILKAGYAEVLLYARDEHLDPHRKPRIERAAPGPADAAAGRAGGVQVDAAPPPPQPALLSRAFVADLVDPAPRQPGVGDKILDAYAGCDAFTDEFVAAVRQLAELRYGLAQLGPQLVGHSRPSIRMHQASIRAHPRSD
jgi:hypothetical protein